MTTSALVSVRAGVVAATAALFVSSSAWAQTAAAAPESTASRQDIQITFAAQVGDRPFKCGERYEGVGLNKATILPQDFRLYISEVRLLAATGAEVPLSLTPDGRWQSDRVALIDFENDTGNCSGTPGMNGVVRGTAPKGDYRGVVFTIGVPQDINHLDPTTAKAPLNVSSLFWPWRVGYKFTSIVFDSSQPPVGAPNMPGLDATTYSMVLGSMECGDGLWGAPPNAPCRSPNRPVFRLESFDVSRRAVTLDLAALFAATDLAIRPPNSDTSCWSFPENDTCLSIMGQLGLVFRGRASTGQTFVRKD